MLTFEPLQLSDRERYLRCFDRENSQNSTYSFGTVYLWSLSCKRNITQIGERIVVEYRCRAQNYFYCFPLGEGDLCGIVATLRTHTAANRHPLSFRAITADQKAALESALPGCFDFTAEEDEFDYIYDAGALASLAGKKLHGKRNHCNRFEASYDWQCEKLTPAHFDDCRSILSRWEESNVVSAEEQNALNGCFDHWDALDLCGAILYADGLPVAFSVGEFLRSDTLDIHFEKAVDGVQGAYPMICREFVRQQLAERPDLRYVNREEDMGIPGLRKAKEDWRPLYKLEKYTAVWREDR